jgi:hypothetical protein
MRCDHCQALLLDHLYGLLDGPDGAAVDAHLADCPDCTTALESARKARDLFVRAAKLSFPDVRFTPPTEAEPAVAASQPDAATPSAAVPTTPPARRRDWSAWASVAAVLVLIPSAILPVRHVTGNYDDARHAADEASGRYGEARSRRDGIVAGVRVARRPVEVEYNSARDWHDAVLAEWVANEQIADRAERNRKLAIEVDRPAAVQPGAPNEIVVVVKDTGALPPGRVEAEVRDQDKRVIASQVIDPARRDNRHPVRIPAKVWAELKPTSELYLTVSTVDTKTNTRTDLINPVRLFGPVYATMLVTDKATYRPGERVYFRSLTLDRVSFRPPEHDSVLRFELRVPVGKLEEVGAASPVRVTDGKVEPVIGPDDKPVRGVGCGAFVLPANLPDGDYTLVLSEEGTRATIPVPVTRTIRVRSGQPEKFAKRVWFEDPSFAPGQMVVAWCELKLGDKPVPEAKVFVAAEADGNVVVIPGIPANGLQTNSEGQAKITFPMPRQVPRGDVRLKVTFVPADGSRAEWVVEPVPVVGREVFVEFFAEGGEPIAGVPTKMYVRATTPAGQPVDIHGTVTDGKDEVVEVKMTTDPKVPGANRGLGAFTFTPKAKTKYFLRLDRPVVATVNLPTVKDGGVAMHVLNPVTEPGQPVRVQLHSTDKRRTLLVGAYTRGRLADTRSVDVEPGKVAEVELMAGDDPRGGVTRITVFEMPNAAPVAERLVFRKPGERLNLAYAAKSDPDGRVDLTVTATDEKGNPVSAIVWVAAVNSAVTPGPRDRLLPTHFLLAGEVQTPDALEYADFLLTNDPKAAESLDRVLATQGWRRFVEQKPPVDLTQDRRTPFLDTDRLQLLNGNYRGATETPLERDRQWVTGQFAPTYEDAVEKLDAAQKAKDTVHADRSWEPAYQRAQQETDERRQVVAEQLDEMRSAVAPLTTARKLIWATVGGLVVLGGAFALAGFRGRRPFGLAAAGALGLAGFLLVSESAMAARAGTPIPSPPDNTLPDLTSSTAHSGVTAYPLGDPTQRPDPKRFVSGQMRVASAKPPVIPPTNTVDRGPGIPLLDREPIRPGRVPPVSAEAIRQAAGEKAAAAEYADGRAQAIRARLDTAFRESATSAPINLTDIFSRLRTAVPRTPPLVVREYAAPRPTPTARADDEPDTVLWQPVLVLPYTGKATVSFHAGAAPGGYQVLVAGHTLDGRLGAVRGILPIAPPAPVLVK